MDGKRFGVGLAAGLLLGLAVVVASAGFGTGSLYGSLSSSGRYSAATSTVSSTLTEAATTTTAQPSYPNGGIVPPTGKNVTEGVVTTMTEALNTFGNSSNSAGLASSLSSLSSNVATIPHQPLLSNAVVFIPVFVAFLLGAVLYRVSRPKDVAEP